MSRRPGSMPPDTRAAMDAELVRGRSRIASADRWAALERAHILSQPWVRPHLRVHVSMLRLALHQRDAREAVGQVVRLAVAGPGSAVGRYPVGNTGRSNVGLTEVMSIPDDLRPLLPEAAP